MTRALIEQLEERRLLAFGALVTAGFGNAGHVVTSFPGSAAPIVTDLQVSAGKILAGGDSGLVRYLPDGTPDGSFGQSGRVSIHDLSFTAMAVDGDGHVYVLGQTTARTVLLRYQPDGELDGGYRSDGTALVTASNAFAPQALAVQSDGKVLVAGVASRGSDDSAVARVYRLEADGSPDLGFGIGAATDIQLGTSTLLSPSLVDHVAGMVVETNGSILIGGGAMSYFPGGFDPVSGQLKPFAYGDTMFAVARLSAEGTLDSSYATGGIRRSTFVSGAKSNLPGAFAVMDDGTAALATSDAASGRVIFASFSPDGMLEVNQTADAGYELSRPLDMTTGSDGKFFLLGDNPRRSHGLQIAAATPAGLFSNVIYTEDPRAAQTSIIGGTVGQIAMSGQGDLIVAGQAKSPGYALSKYQAGSTGANAGDQLANARSNSIFRDALGGLHVAYFDAAERVLKYSYRAPDGIWNAPVTVDATDNAGQYVSVGADAEGNPGIAYFEGTHGDFKFAWRSDGQWQTETVDSRGSVGLYPSMIYYGSGWPAVAYFDKTHGDLKFAVRNMTTGKWGFEAVQRAGIVGRSSALAINPYTGRFEVAYVDSGDGLVNWARHLSGGRWGYETAAATSGGADFLSLAYTNQTHEPSIAFYDAGPADLKLTTFSGTSWINRPLVTRGAIGLYNTLQYDSRGAAIYTYDRTHDQALLLRIDPSGLEAESIASGGGRYLSVFTDGSIADMVYFDSTDAVLQVRGAPVIVG